jgi:hypothetical protein
MALATHAADTEGDAERAPTVFVDGLSVEGDTETPAFDKIGYNINGRSLVFFPLVPFLLIPYFVSC